LERPVSARPRRIRLAIDIGGTFTDLAAYDAIGNQLTFTKSPTTPRDLTNAILTCIEKVDIDLGNVELFIHGSTVGINTVIERKGPKTALLTTKGFRDVYEMGRRNRPEIYDLFFHRPRPLIPRDLRFEVVERLDSSGRVLTALDERALIETLRTGLATGFESLAICLLHSYANSAHEKRVGELVRTHAPNVDVSLSSDINREYREYERTSTTAINAYLTPVVGRYLTQLEGRLEGRAFRGRTLIMQSSGGVMSLAAAARQPVRIIESGPAGGVAGVLWLCAAVGKTNAIAFDMGGTTAKACLIEDGRAKVTADYHVGGRISGLPVQVPFLDIVEIGAGGGSIASIDSVGAIRVGPQSAGADPGPACYDHGGVEPTVTDANLLVGKLSATRFLGGEMLLRRDLAEAAYMRFGKQLGLNPVEAANGVLRIANAMMARSVSKVTVERGRDPRDFTMICYGGAGPMHATAVARELGVRHVVVPQAAAQFSALGMLTTDIRHDISETFPVVTSRVVPADLELRFAGLEEDARSQLANEVADDDITFHRSADMRYLGQFHTLTVGLPDGPIDGSFAPRVGERFHSAHELAYGHSAPALETEIINLRLAAFVKMTKPSLPPIANGQHEPPAAAKSPGRDVVWEDGSNLATAIFVRDKLLARNRILGPAVIEDYASVIPVAAGDIATVDEFGHLHIQLRQQ
jgi:N-methylhydantoinase A